MALISSSARCSGVLAPCIQGQEALWAWAAGAADVSSSAATAVARERRSRVIASYNGARAQYLSAAPQCLCTQGLCAELHPQDLRRPVVGPLAAPDAEHAAGPEGAARQRREVRLDGVGAGAGAADLEDPPAALLGAHHRVARVVGELRAVPAAGPGDQAHERRAVAQADRAARAVVRKGLHRGVQER